MVSEEKSYVNNALTQCGYPHWAFKKANSNKQSTTNQQQGSSNTTRNKTLAVIPYISGISDRIKKIYKKHGINTCFKPSNTLRSKLVKVKDKTPHDKTSNIVYGIKCEGKDCDATYIGETKQALSKRMNQHKRPVSGETYDSAVYTHMQATGHSFNNKNVKVMDREQRWFERGVREAIWERVERPTLNKKGGLRFKLSPAWDRANQLISRRLMPSSVDVSQSHSQSNN